MVYDTDNAQKIDQDGSGAVHAWDLEQFRELVDQSDIIYGSVSLNAAQTIKARIKKGSLKAKLAEMQHMRPYQQSFYASFVVDKKGRKILSLV